MNRITILVTAGVGMLGVVAVDITTILRVSPWIASVVCLDTFAVILVGAYGVILLAEGRMQYAEEGSSGQGQRGTSREGEV
jgi:branched-subunit amino acid ABC-type transport system permease component